jgi:Co/Zn/Cd efflux system component
MMIVSTTGYIISVLGPFLSDSTNNDANILKHVFLNNMEDVLNWVEEVC